MHGAIASAAVYGAMMGATAKQIESAIGKIFNNSMFCKFFLRSDVHF
jgi:2-methylcitrate dehydratase PrpD